MSAGALVKYFLYWRLIVILIALLGFFILPFQSNFTFMSRSFDIKNLYSSWSNFDGVHYLDIARYGYGVGGHTDKAFVFFPVYPLLIQRLGFSGDFYIGAMLISHLSLLVALYYLYKLIRMDLSDKIAKFALFLLLIFPTSFFFGSVYTESLFLMVSVLAFYHLRQKNIFLACLFAAIASATRITGIFLWPALFIDFLIQNKWQLKSLMQSKIAFFVIPPFGLLSYMYYQFVKTGDALFFITSQANFGGRTTEKLISLPQVFYRYFKMITTFSSADPVYFTTILELVCSILILAIIVFGFRKMRMSYLFYVTASYLLPTLTGTFLSIPRFALVLFPLFPVLATWITDSKPLYKYLYVGISLVFAIFTIILFTHGYFIG